MDPITVRPCKSMTAMLVREMGFMYKSSKESNVGL